MEKIKNFVKKETVLVTAWILAVVSMAFYPPSKEYIEYIDFRSLGILWGLMVIMEGLRKVGFFDYVAGAMLCRIKKVWQIVLVLVLLCFFFSMFITNDVALITFVPFAIYILEICSKEKLLIFVICLQTLAANLGSMLTPIGNPQNLYLYGLSGMTFVEFIKVMLPYTVVSLVLLLIVIFSMKGKRESIDISAADSFEKKEIDCKKTAFYGIMFLIAIFVVARVIPFWVLVVVVLAVTFLLDRKVIVSVDYALLFTFTGFFIFTGNLSRISFINDWLTMLVGGREVLFGVGLSQLISNVPAALLLSAFTADYRGLLVGVNIGGLGTLIASMASLISYKALANAHNDMKGRYLLVFTAANAAFLVVLLLLSMIL